MPISSTRQAPNLKPSFETSSEVVDARMSRARGPHSPIVVIADVRSTSSAPAVRWSRNHFLSDMPAAPPVTTRKWCSSRRMTVRSDLKPPSTLSTGVYTTRPAGTSIWRSTVPCREASAPGPVMSKIVNADRSKMPARSRMARCSALMIGDHQRASHSAVRRVTRSPYSSTSGALDSYQKGRSQPAASKKKAPSSFSRAWNGASRTSRFEAHCSAGWTMP